MDHVLLHLYTADQAGRERPSLPSNLLGLSFIHEMRLSILPPKCFEIY